MTDDASPPDDSSMGASELEEQIAKLTDMAARAQADLQNYKQRAEKDKDDLRQMATIAFLSTLLPVFDDLERLGEHLDSEEGLRGGYEQVMKKLHASLQELSVTRMESLGQTVDPSKHEVLNTGPGEKDVITSVHEEGYELHGKVLRPAKVQVGDGS